MRVEVAYALPERQTLLEVEVPESATVRDAIERSGVLARHPEIDLATQRVGIFGRPARLDDGVGPDDRIEIYRPLIADPRAGRHERVARRRAGRDGERNMRA